MFSHKIIPPRATQPRHVRLALTYCRSSWQIVQAAGGWPLSTYCVPQGDGPNTNNANGPRPSMGSTNYAGNVWVFTETPTNILAAIPDGTSNTVFFCEIYQNCNNRGDGPAWAWIEPWQGPP